MDDAQPASPNRRRRRLARVAGALCAVCLVAAIVLVTTWISSYGQIYRVSLTWFGPCEMQLTQGQAIFTRYVAIGSGENDDDDRPSTSAPGAQPITWERHLPGIWYGQGDMGHGVAYQAVALRLWLIVGIVVGLFLLCLRFSGVRSKVQEENQPVPPAGR